MRALRLIFTLCFLLAPLHAETPQGSALSVALENNLTQQGFICGREQLATTAQDAFPFNIEITLNATADNATLQVSAENALINSRNVVIFAFTQQDAYEHFDAILTFLQHVQGQPLPYDVVILFAAQENSPLPTVLTGTGIFSQNIDDADSATAVVVSFGAQTAILAGTIRSISPLWLSQRLVSAFDEARVPFSYAHHFSALYRLGFLRGDARQTAFVMNNIPAVAVSFDEDDELRVLSAFVDAYQSAGTELWDSHYIFLRLPPPFKPLWIGEQFFFMFCLVLGTLFLVILCFLSFVGKDGAYYKQDFKRSWYLIPLTIAVTYGSFWLGQTVCKAVPFLVQATPLVQFGIKLIFALFFISVLFSVQQYFRVTSVQFTHGYFIYVIGIANIFLFSAVDISFFATFLVEYFCIYIARKAVRIVPLIISVLLMLIPFVPYVYLLLRDGYAFDLQRLVLSPPLYNLMLSMLVFPFLIMWLRMLTRMEFYAATSNFSLKTMLLQGSLSTGVIIAVTIVCIVALSVFSRQTMRRSAREEIDSINENRYSFEISATEDAFYGMTTHHVTVTTKEPVLRYEVSLTSESSVPLYDSTYDYTINEETKTAVFTVPDYPPEKITIDYAAGSGDVATFFVTAWFLTDEKNVFRRESHAYIINGAR